MKGMVGRLTGEPEHFAFEERIFHVGVLLGIVLTIFGTVMDVYYKADIFIDLVFVGCWLLTYYLSRHKGYFQLVSVVSIVVLVFAFIPFMWIASGGVRSVLPYYIVVFTVVISMIISGRFRIIMLISMLLIVLLLICRDTYMIGSAWVPIYPGMRVFDVAVHLAVILLSMAVLVIVYSNTYMKEKARNEAYARTIEEQYRQQLYYMENLEKLNEKLKAERHDFNNHLGVIYGLLESGDTVKADDYVRQLVKTAEEYRNLVNIPYSMVRALLNYKLSVAADNGIKLRLDTGLPENLRVNEFDLAVILGNLLDNAMEACGAIEESSRYIALNISYKPDYLIIMTENPVTRNDEQPNEGTIVTVDGEILTTKPEAENHGFGLKNIAYVVNKHNGLMKIEQVQGFFKVNIALLVETWSETLALQDAGIPGNSRYTAGYL